MPLLLKVRELGLDLGKGCFPVSAIPYAQRGHACSDLLAHFLLAQFVRLVALVHQAQRLARGGVASGFHLTMDETLEFRAEADIHKDFSGGLPAKLQRDNQN
jgi:hypothetical protein